MSNKQHLSGVQAGQTYWNDSKHQNLMLWSDQEDRLNDSKLVSVYDSQTEKYHKAFEVFLKHTDQKVNAKKQIDKLVKQIPNRRVFIDAGAGNGQVTSWYSGKFEETKFNKTIAIEPNTSLCDELRLTCPSCEVLPQKILQAQPEALGDFILCSHVFYYIQRDKWLPNLQKLVSWLSDEGLLVVILQNQETDCMQMIAHFFGERYNISELKEQFCDHSSNDYQSDIELVEAHVTTEDFDSAYIIAEFLNSIPIPEPPPLRRDLEQYIRKEFRHPDGGYRFSCHQDFLLIRKALLGKVKTFQRS